MCGDIEESAIRSSAVLSCLFVLPFFLGSFQPLARVSVHCGSSLPGSLGRNVPDCEDLRDASRCPASSPPETPASLSETPFLVLLRKLENGTDLLTTAAAVVRSAVRKYLDSGTISVILALFCSTLDLMHTHTLICGGIPSLFTHSPPPF